MNEQRRPGLTEALIVWALFAAVALAVFITYWRIPPEELYQKLKPFKDLVSEDIRSGPSESSDRGD